MIEYLKNKLRASFLHTEGEELIEANEFEKAEIVLERALKLIPDTTNQYGRIQSSLGYSLWQKGKIEDANEHLSKGAQLSDCGVKEYMRYIDFLIEQERYEDAIPALIHVSFNDTEAGIEAAKAWREKYELCLSQVDESDRPKEHGCIYRY
jgi:tetratricopeptide (TPR) repeat protein